MPIKTLVLLAHPSGAASLSGGLAQAYVAGAREAGAEIRYQNLSDLDFDLHVRHRSPKQQALEPDLCELKAAIEWADHLVLVYPTWWGTYPALLKGLLDRILLEGWAFEETTGGTGFEGLLGGRTAELITTMDMPRFAYRFVMRAPGRNALARATLGFCGIDVVRHTRFGVVKDSDAAERSGWIEQARELGVRLRDGVHSPLQRLWRAVMPWLLALRLQFYPMTFVAYWVGALLATRESPMDLGAFAIGYAILFAMEAATVFFNDIYDFDSDRRNRFYSLFSGGSRVLIEEKLSVSDLRKGAIWALAIALALTLLLLGATSAPLFASLFMLMVLGLAAIFYTVPPIKFSHRSLGEVDVALTHSFGVLFCGFVFQNGLLTDALPWLISVLLFLAVLPAITLAGVPDVEADRAAGKHTLAVRFSVRSAMLIAAFLAAATAILAATFDWSGIADGVLSGLGIIALIHGAFLAWQILRHRSKLTDAARIDPLLVAALTFIIWFGAIPLVNLLRAA